MQRADEFADIRAHRRRLNVAVGRAGDAEVQQFWEQLAVAIFDEDVARLQVAMNDALLVCVLHRVADARE